MSKVWLAPTGKVTRGHVLDVALKPFERALKDYDSQLYVKWNPKKLRGWGAWEIRRKPESQTIVDYAEYAGVTFFKLDYQEIDLISHVLDCAFLNYDQLRKIQEMDTFGIGVKQWQADREHADKQREIAAKERAKSEMLYMAKQHKREFKEFKELVLSGNSPHEVMRFWDDKADS